MKRIGFALFAVVVGLFLTWTVARAGYPEDVKKNYVWYVCTTYTNSGSVAFSEPSCQELAFGISAPYWDSISFEGQETCGPGSCSLWVRRYVVPPVGVASFRLSCAVSAHTNDQGLGAGSAQVRRGTVDSAHISTSGTNLGVDGAGLTTYWFTHTTGTGHDFGSNTHDPFYDWLSNGGKTTGYKGAYVETVQTTSGTQVDTLAGLDCILDAMTGSYTAPTPTPTRTNTPVPVTPTPTSTPTPGPATPTPTRTPGGWPTPLPWIPTPRPGGITYGEPSEPSCYVLLPSFGPYTANPMSIFEFDFGWEEAELCVSEVAVGIEIFGWDIGAWAMTLLTIAGLGVVIAWIRT